MSTTVTDIFRPVTIESATWIGFDIDQVNDEVVEPDAGDASGAAADTAEQVVIMGPPASENYSSVTQLEVKFLAGAAFDDADLVVRVRVRGNWIGPVVVPLADVLSWHTASFALNTSRGELNDLAVGIAKDGAALVLIDAFYVTSQGPADFVQPAEDLSLFDGTEAVRLVRADGDESLITHALRRVVTCEEATRSAGTHQRHDVTWHIPASETQNRPQVGEWLIDDEGDRWTILVVEWQTLGTRYRCRARQLAIDNDLTHQVDVQRAVWTKDVHGAQVAQWFDWRRGVQARVQPVVATAVEQRDQRTIEATHQVFFALPIELDHNARIVHEATVYRVVAVSDTDRIDVLMTADVVKVN